jgi:hypothetical protein
VPSIPEHQQKAAHNERAYNHLRAGGPYPDWAATAAFYSALHEVEAFLRARGRKPSGNHDGRRAALEPWPIMAAAYESLESRSMDTRYRCYMPTARDLNSCRQALDTIRAEIANNTI